MFIAMTASCDTSQQLLVFVVTRSEKLELAAEERRYRINLAKAQGWYGESGGISMLESHSPTICRQLCLGVLSNLNVGREDISD